MRLCAASRSRSACASVFAAGGQARLGVAHVFFAAHQFAAQLLEALLALEHARMRIAAAVDAQPVASDPLARARDHRFVVRQLAAQLQRFGQVLRQPHARQQPHDGRAVPTPRPTTCRRRHRLPRARRPAAATSPHRQRRQHIGQRVQLVDAQRFEIVAERGFDRALPAAAHAELRREPRLAAPGPAPSSHSAVRESPRPSAAFCKASSDTTSARRARARRAPFRAGSRLRTARRAVSASDRARRSAPATIRRRCCAPVIPSRRAARAAPRIPAPSALRARWPGGRTAPTGGAAGFPAARYAPAPPAWSGARRPARG